MDAQDRSRAERIAYHEAGHAISALLTGSYRVERVARVAPTPGGHPEMYHVLPEDLALRLCRRRAFTVKLAGIDAERRLCLQRAWPFDWWRHGGQDALAVRQLLVTGLVWAAVQQYGQDKHGPRQQLNQVEAERWRFYFTSGGRLLFDDSRAWAMTERLAHALLDEPTGILQGEQLQRVLHSIQGPVMLDELKDRTIRRLFDPSTYPSASSSYKLGGHPPGYQQNRDKGGRWAPGEGHEGEGRGGLHAQHATHAHGSQGSAGSGETRVHYEDPVKVRAAMHGIFGRELSDGEMAGLAGAQRGDYVHVQAYGPRVLHIEAFGPGYNPATGDKGMAAWQSWHDVFKDSRDGLVYDHLAYMRVNASGQGQGAHIVQDMVRNQSRAGVNHIILDAARSDIPGMRMNGYYTWARMGWDGKLTATHLAGAPKRLQRAQTMRELMHTPGGRDWWKANGSNWSGTFDLHHGSQSWRDLDVYLRRKGLGGL